MVSVLVGGWGRLAGADPGFLPGESAKGMMTWDGNERFLTYAHTYLQLFMMFIAILCLNGVEKPFKRHQCPFFLPLRLSALLSIPIT